MALPKIIGTQYGSPNAAFTAEKGSKIWTRRKTFEETKIILANCDDDEDDIKGVTGVPDLFSTLRGMTCIDVSPKEVDSVLFEGQLANLWEVVCKYDSSADPTENGDQDPTQKTPVVKWLSEDEDEHMEKDQAQNPVQTAANEPLFVTKPMACPILEVTRYEDYPFDPDVILDYVNRTNSAAFYGAPIGTVLMKGINSEEEDVEQIKYCKVTYRMKFKLKFIPVLNILDVNTWRLRLLHAGQKYRKFAGAPPIVWMDAEGNTGTINLNPDGTARNPNLLPHYLEFIRFATNDFNNLSLGPF